MIKFSYKKLTLPEVIIKLFPLELVMPLLLVISPIGLSKKLLPLLLINMLEESLNQISKLNQNINLFPYLTLVEFKFNYLSLVLFLDVLKEKWLLKLVPNVNPLNSNYLKKKLTLPLLNNLEEINSKEDIFLIDSLKSQEKSEIPEKKELKNLKLKNLEFLLEMLMLKLKLTMLLLLKLVMNYFHNLIIWLWLKE